MQQKVFGPFRYDWDEVAAHNANKENPTAAAPSLSALIAGL